MPSIPYLKKKQKKKKKKTAKNNNKKKKTKKKKNIAHRTITENNNILFVLIGLTLNWSWWKRVYKRNRETYMLKGNHTKIMEIVNILTCLFFRRPRNKKRQDYRQSIPRVRLWTGRRGKCYTWRACNKGREPRTQQNHRSDQTNATGKVVFSSPEPKAHRWAYSIPMLLRPSVVRPSFTISKIFSSETAWPIKAKLHVQHP